VVISASHNPWHDNGVKFFDSQGSKLSSETEHSIESAWESLAHDRQTETAPVVFGRSYARTDLIDRYREELLQETQAPSNHFPLHVIVDCAHGAATPVWSQSFFDSLGLKGSLLHTEPNGTNINQNCGATHLDTLTEAVLRSGADLGIAFDGDADRALFIDARGHEVDGDATLAILARSWIESEGSIPSGQVVATVMSNLGLETALRKDSISLVRTDVGDRHVAEAMKNRGSAIGGEQSGHIIVRSHIHPDLLVGDGTRTALAILKRMTTSGLSLQELASAYTRCPQVLVNVPVREKPPFDSIPAVVDAQNRILDSLQNRGRILLRYSGTEPIARVMLEGEDREEIEALASPLIEALHSSLGTAKSS
jgi:phosphoglucosamine mutase